MKTANTTLSDALDNEILPALQANLLTAFPEFGWKEAGKAWQATNAAHCATLDGSPKPHQVEVYRDHTGRAGFQIHGGTGRTFIPWVHYVSAGQQRPTGKAFVEAVKELARRAGVQLQQQTSEWGDRYASNLRRNPAAIEWFTKTRGLPQEYIERYQLGLSGPAGQYRGYTDALAFPLLGPRGNHIILGEDKPKTAYAYYYIPGVTTWQPDAKQKGNGWVGAGVSPPRTYYTSQMSGKLVLVVVEGFKDAWAMQSMLDQDPELQETVLVITSSNGTGHPVEWRQAVFWEPWQKVYLAGDNDGPGLANQAKIRGYSEREIHQVLVPAARGKDWNDFIRKGGTVAELRGLMKDARLMNKIEAEGLLRRLEKTPGAPITTFGLGDIKAVDILSAFHNNHLYHCFDQHVTEKSESSKEVKEGLRPVVLRSDGEIFEAMVSRVVRQGDKAIIRLAGDGTVITRLPVASTHATWRGSSIKAFVDATKARRKPQIDLGVIVEQLRRHFAAQVWLPYSEDYTVLALSIVVSYAQELFDAVPLILMSGEKGTGKSEVARIAAEVGCNGIFLAKATASGIINNADLSRGFMAIDDFEELGVRSRTGEAIYGTPQQIVKLSYKKATATYDKTGSKGEAIKQRYYGVKLITMTQGVDEIVGSRMLKIATRRIPEAMRDTLKKRAADVLEPEAVASLRDSLHTWVFSNVSEIRLAYLSFMAEKGDRADEIAAPLRTVAKFVGQKGVSESLEQALARRAMSADITDEQEALQVAISRLVAIGYDHVSAPQVINEMTSLLGEEYGKAYTTDIPSWQQPHVIGRRLKDSWCEPQRSRAVVQFGYKLSVLKLLPDRLEEIKQDLKKAGTEVSEIKKNPGDFCRGCDACSYRAHCSIRSGVARKESELAAVQRVMAQRAKAGKGAPARGGMSMDDDVHLSRMN